MSGPLSPRKRDSTFETNGGSAADICGGLFEQASDGARLITSRCTTCGHLAFPARPGCPACCDGDSVPFSVGPIARLSSFTSVHHRTPGSRLEPPYAVGTADFPEGITVLGLIALPSVDTLAIGQTVTVALETVINDESGRRRSYLFRPQP